MKKHAMIIGATGAIGSALAAALHTDYQLTLVGRDIAILKAHKESYGSTIIPCDVANELEVQALFQESDAIDVLIYTAGAVEPQLIKTTPASSWQTVMDANLTGVFYTLKHAANKLNKARVFVVGARPELVNYRGFAVYAAAKAAVARLLELAAIEMKRQASFTLVLPKAVASSFWDNVGKIPQDALAPREVADAIQQSLAGNAVAELLVG